MQHKHTVKPNVASRSKESKTRVAERSCIQQTSPVKNKRFDNRATVKIDYNINDKISSFMFSNNLLSKGSSKSDERAISLLKETWKLIDDMQDIVEPEAGWADHPVINNTIIKPLLGAVCRTVEAAVTEQRDASQERTELLDAIREGTDQGDLPGFPALARQGKALSAIFALMTFCIIYMFFTRSDGRTTSRTLTRISMYLLMFTSIYISIWGVPAPAYQTMIDIVQDALGKVSTGHSAQESDDVTPENGSIDFDASILIGPLVAAMLCGSTVMEKNFDKTMVVKNVTAMWLARKPLTEMITFLLNQLENNYNMLQDRYGNGQHVRIIKSSLEGVEKRISDINLILNSNARGEYFRTRGNYDHLKLTLYNLRTFIRSCPGDIRPEVVRVLRPYEKRLIDLEEEFGKKNFSQIGIRPEPVVTMFHGGPGTAKSIAMNAFSLAVTAKTIPDTMAQAFLEQPNSFVYNRSISQEYWDGYENQWTCMLEEVGQNLPSQNGITNEFAELIAMANTAPMSLHMASVEAKGSKFFTSRFVNCTSNSRNFQNSCLISKEAFLRRMDFKYVVTPKKGYTRDTDLTKDLWNRKIDMDKIEKVDVGVDTPYGPTIYEATDLSEYHLDFWPSDKEGRPLTSTPLGFDEIVDLAVNRSFVKLAWYEMYRQRMDQTIKQALSERPPSLYNNGYESDDEEPIWTTQEDSNSYLQMSTVEPEVGIVYPDEDRAFLAEEGLMLIYNEDRAGIHETDSSQFEEIYCDLSTIYRSVFCSVFMGAVFKITGKTVDDHVDYVDFVNTYKYLRYYGGDMIDVHLFETNDYVAMEHLSHRILRVHVITQPGYFSECGERDPLDVQEEWRIFEARCRREEETWLMKGRKRLQRFLDDHIYIKWLYERKAWIIGLVTLISTPFLCKAISSWFGVNEPESWNYSDKTFRNKNSPQRFAAKNKFSKAHQKSDPENATHGDDAGFNIALSTAQSNLWLIQMPDPHTEGKWYTLGHVLMVKGNVGVIPYHFVPYIADLMEEFPSYVERKMRLSRTTSSVVYVSIMSFMENVNYDFVPSEDDDLERDEKYSSINNDWITVLLPAPFQPARDITRFFMSKDKMNFVNKNIPFAMPSLNSGRVLQMHHNMAQVHRNLIVTPDKSDPAKNYVIRDSYVYDGFTSRGDCGAPLFVMNTRTGNEKIFALHAAGCAARGASYGGAICKEDLLHQVNSYGFNPTPVNLPESGAFKTEDFIDGRFPVLGVVQKGPMACLKTEIAKSDIYGCFPDDPPITKPAHLRPFTRIDAEGAIQHIDPWDKSHRKFGKEPPLLNDNILKMIEDEYFGDILRTGQNKVNVRTFSTDEALFGIDTCESFNMMEGSTSAGFPMNVQGCRNVKKELFSDPFLSVSERRSLPAYEEICTKVAELETAYLAGFNETFVYTDNGKDERIEIAKSDEGKLRKFCGIPFYMLLMMRKYFGSFMVFTMENKVVNSIAAGVNPYSDDWNRIAQHLRNDDTDYSVDAGDFSSFDGSQNIDIVMTIFNIVDRWYCLYEEPEAYLVNSIIRKGLWSSKACSVHISRNILFEILGNESSGNYGTSVFNSMYNILCFRYCLKLVSPTANFGQQVHIITMGDDVVYSVDTPLRAVFNGLTMPDLMSQVGMTYTSETKGVSMVPWRNITEVEFLKRRFVFCRELGKYIGPMRLNAVLEICQWTKTRDRYTIMCGNVDCTLGELSLHNKDIYIKYQDYLIRAMSELRVPVVFPERLFQSWRERRFSVIESGFTYLQ